MSDLEQPEKKGVSRRTVAKAMAWSVPAIAIAAPVPAMAASGPPPSGTINGMCKLPGNACGGVFVKGYVLEVTLTNTSGEDVYLYNNGGIYDIVIVEDNPDISLFFQAAVEENGTVVTFPYLFPANTTVTLVINAGENGNSANQSMTVSLFIPWGHTMTPGADPDNHPPFVVGPTFIPDTPPEQNPDCTVDVPC